MPALTDINFGEIARRALLTYAVYAATNAARHGGTCSANEAMGQFVREACAAHTGLAAKVAEIWR